jgi:hypothetical protein
MITCKTCKKFAKLDFVLINGLDEFVLIGSCKHCGYTKEPALPKKYNGSIIRKLKSRIDYDDFEELGIDC